MIIHCLYNTIESIVNYRNSLDNAKSKYVQIIYKNIKFLPHLNYIKWTFHIKNYFTHQLSSKMNADAIKCILNYPNTLIQPIIAIIGHILKNDGVYGLQYKGYTLDYLNKFTPQMTTQNTAHDITDYNQYVNYSQNSTIFFL